MQILINDELNLVVGGAGNETITVVSAVYKCSHNSCDATGVVSKMCNGVETCSVLAADGLCGDPCPGETKYLEVWYKCQTTAKSTMVEQKSYAELFCP